MISLPGPRNNWLCMRDCYSLLDAHLTSVNLVAVASLNITRLSPLDVSEYHQIVSASDKCLVTLVWGHVIMSRGAERNVSMKRTH